MCKGLHFMTLFLKEMEVLGEQQKKGCLWFVTRSHSSQNALSAQNLVKIPEFPAKKARTLIQNTIILIETIRIYFRNLLARTLANFHNQGKPYVNIALWHSHLSSPLFIYISKNIATFSILGNVAYDNLEKWPLPLFKRSIYDSARFFLTVHWCSGGRRRPFKFLRLLNVFASRLFLAALSLCLISLSLPPFLSLFLSLFSISLIVA